MLLKNTLLANVSFSLVCGITLLVLPGKISALMGSFPSWLLMVIGGCLVVFAADVYWISRHLPHAKARAQVIFLADIAWVLITPIILALFYSSFSQLGIIVFIDITLVVAVLAFFEWKGLQELTHRSV